MTAIIIAVAVVVVCGLLLWVAIATARSAGRAAAESELNQRMAEHAETQGRIMAEHRDPERTAERMRDGSF